MIIDTSNTIPPRRADRGPCGQGASRGVWNAKQLGRPVVKGVERHPARRHAAGQGWFRQKRGPLALRRRRLEERSVWRHAARGRHRLGPTTPGTLADSGASSTTARLLHRADPRRAAGGLARRSRTRPSLTDLPGEPAAALQANSTVDDVVEIEPAPPPLRRPTRALVHPQHEGGSAGRHEHRRPSTKSAQPTRLPPLQGLPYRTVRGGRGGDLRAREESPCPAASISLPEIARSAFPGSSCPPPFPRTLRGVLEDAQTAPSNSNTQPWSGARRLGRGAGRPGKKSCSEAEEGGGGDLPDFTDG